MPPGRFTDQSLADRASAISARHLRIGAGFINEYELLGIKFWLSYLPALARFRDVGPILFSGVQSFF